jgi:hypothetical protein
VANPAVPEDEECLAFESAFPDADHRRNERGEYFFEHTQYAWVGWQRRAHIQRHRERNEGEAVAVVGYVDRFSADRLLVEQALRAAVVKCEKVADSYYERGTGRIAKQAARACARAVRALIPQEPKEEGKS